MKNMKNIKKCLLGALLAACMLLGFTACDSQEPPTRGMWDGNVFTSEYLNLRFVLPTGFVALSDVEMAAIAGEAYEFVVGAGGVVPDEVNMFRDVHVINQFTGCNIQIMYERLTGRAASPARQMDAIIDQLTGLGIRATADTGTTRIGNYDWHSLRTEFTMAPGVVVYGRQFFNIRGRHARLIVISSPFADSALFTDLSDMFAGLTGSLPQPMSAQRAAQLTATWEWDEDDTWIYQFNADGTGQRGFPNQRQSFEWYLAADHTLILALPSVANPANVELWTATLVGNSLTLDSQQVPGMSYSYIRQ